MTTYFPADDEEVMFEKTKWGHERGENASTPSSRPRIALQNQAVAGPRFP
jgi:hypothetical protein